MRLPKTSRAALLNDLDIQAIVQSLGRGNLQWLSAPAGNWERAVPEKAPLLAALKLLGFENLIASAIDEHQRISGEEIDSFIGERLAFIREKNWAEADRIRDELSAKGIQLKDGKDPETGERVTTWEVKR